jgi:hypothetical protein
MKDAMCLMLLAGVLSAVCDGVDPADVPGLPEGVERVEIFLLMGQSNMKGRGELPTSQTPHPRILNMNLADDHIGDFLHYNTEAQEIIGKRYAAEFLRLIGE